MTKLRNVWKNLKNKREQAGKDEGSGLITILGVTMVVGIVATSVTMSAAVSTNFTYTQLNSQQASDFSDAAMADAVSMLSNDDIGYNACFYEHNDGKVSTKNYDYTVYHSSGAEVPVNGVDDPQVEQGCPTSEDNWVLVKVDGKGRQDTLSSETAVYEIAKSNEEYMPHALQAGKVDLKGVGDLSVAQGVSASQPTIFVNDGNLVEQTVYCDKNRAIKANVFFNNDNTDGSTTAFPGGSTEGCLIEGELIGNGGLTISLLNTINGDVCSHKDVSDNSNAVKGQVLRNQEDCGFYGTMYGYVPQPTAIVKPYSDSTRHCRDWATVQAYLESLPDDKHHIIDLSACNVLGGTANPLKPLNISADMTILIQDQGRTNLLSSTTISSKDGKDHVFNIVRPSTDANASSSSICTTVDNVDKVQFNKGVHGMIYTPCSLNVSNSNIIGQIYSGNKLTMAGNSSLSYMPSALVNAVAPINHDSYTTAQRYSNPRNPALVRVG